MCVRHGALSVRGLYRPKLWTGWIASLLAVVGIQNGRARTVGVGANGGGGARIVGRYDGRNIVSKLAIGFRGVPNVQDDFRKGGHDSGELQRAERFPTPKDTE